MLCFLGSVSLDHKSLDLHIVMAPTVLYHTRGGQARSVVKCSVQQVTGRQAANLFPWHVINIGEHKSTSNSGYFLKAIFTNPLAVRANEKKATGGPSAIHHAN